jgi:hypothetical protein
MQAIDALMARESSQLKMVVLNEAPHHPLPAAHPSAFSYPTQSSLSYSNWSKWRPYKHWSARRLWAWLALSSRRTRRIMTGQPRRSWIWAQREVSSLEGLDRSCLWIFDQSCKISVCNKVRSSWPSCYLWCQRGASGSGRACFLVQCT